MVEPPSNEARKQVTRVLSALPREGRDVAAELFPLVYADLRRLAGARMARLAPGQTLQATALVHEAYLRLMGSKNLDSVDRATFLAAAARAMRNILADHLQQRASLKRGGHFRRVGDDTVACLSADGPGDDVLALEALLEDFEQDYPRAAEVVTLRFFAGLTGGEVAAALQVTTRTVERDWAFAKAWLNSRLAEDPGA